MRDIMEHFCEKHLDKIRVYMEKVSVRIPPPAKCTIEGLYLIMINYKFCLLMVKKKYYLIF